jgi:hypothetical protein
MRQFFYVLSFFFSFLVLAGCSGDTPVISAPQSDVAPPMTTTQSQEAQKIVSADPQVSDIICPKIELLSGAETLRNFEVGASGNDANMTWQASISSMARECSILGAEVGIKAGVSGRVLLGPKGKAGTYQVPVRIAVVRNQAEPLWSRVSLVNATVPPNEASGIFTLVVEDILFPREPSDNLSNLHIYVGFDPEGAKGRASEKAFKKGKAKTQR